jgi:hypothetical protein
LPLQSPLQPQFPLQTNYHPMLHCLGLSDGLPRLAGGHGGQALDLRAAVDCQLMQQGLVPFLG